MIKKIIFGLIVVGIVLSFTSPTIILAGGLYDSEVPNLNQTQIFDMINTIANWVFTALIITSVFIILMAAFQFATAGDKPDAIIQARQKLTWAIVGIIIGLMAKGIPAVIIDILN